MSQFHFDYELLLFVGLIITLFSWGFHRRQKKNQLNKSQQSPHKITTFTRFNGVMAGYLPLLLIVLSVRSFAFEPFRIPSSSMMPTLLTGDFILVDKFSYGLKMPVFHHTLISTGEPERGDVFVFRSVDDPSVDVIKRVIALPGDHVKYDSMRKHVLVNGHALKQLNGQTYQGFHDDISPIGLVEKTELIDGKAHQMLTTNGIDHRFQYTDLVVPQGQYFAMGDNRDYSADSRVFGLIPEENVVGKARMIWMHWRPDALMEGFKRIGTFL